MLVAAEGGDRAQMVEQQRPPRGSHRRGALRNNKTTAAAVATTALHSTTVGGGEMKGTTTIAVVVVSIPSVPIPPAAVQGLGVSVQQRLSEPNVRAVHNVAEEGREACVGRGAGGTREG